MQLLVNGQPRTLPAADQLEAAIMQLVPHCDRVIAELNGVIVKRNAWAQTAIHDGDRLELVTFVGGG